MNPFTEIPPGVRFDPNGEEVVSDYLIPKINGRNLQWPWIAEKDVYSAEPSIVFSGMDPRYWSVKKEGGRAKSWTYAFAKVTKAASNRNSRRVGSAGTWSGQTGPKNIVNSDSGESIGCMRMLSFRRCKNGGGPDDPNQWVMHEYSLIDSGLRAIVDRKDEIVLCKITKFLKDSGRPWTQQQPLPTPPKADQIGRPPPSPLLVKANQIERPPPGEADQIGRPSPPLLSQPLGMNSLAKADQIGNPPPPPLGFPVPDQPWMDSAPMAYDFGDQPPLGFVVSNKPWMHSSSMANYEFGQHPPPLGFPMPHQPRWNYLPMADCIGTPVPDQDQPLYFPVVDAITNKRPAQDQLLLEESSSEQKKFKTFWENLLDSPHELNKILDQSDQTETPAAATAIDKPMMSELKKLGLESEYTGMIHLLELDEVG